MPFDVVDIGSGPTEYPPRETSPPSPRRENTRVQWGKEAHSRITGQCLREQRVWSQLQERGFAYHWAGEMRRGGFIDADADPNHKCIISKGIYSTAFFTSPGPCFLN